jgi:tRNA threonylcarbamoyladenosine modification (KEOPS) complex  Pcc1 subunit
MNAKVNVKLSNIGGKNAELLYGAIRQEEIDKDLVTLELEGNSLSIKICACSYTKTRAILNSYILWLYTILQSLEEVEKNDREITP